MIQPEVLKALNKQINAELESAYMYLSAGSHLDDIGYNGMGSWLIMHAHEEYQHAMRIRNFITDKDEKAIFTAIADPNGNWGDPADVWTKVYEHELEVTRMILDIVELAREKKDITAEIFLNWFVNEQIEEEVITRDILERVKMIGNNAGAMLTYDRFIAKEAKSHISDTAELTDI